MKKYIIKFLQLDKKFYYIYSALLTILFAYLTFSVSGMLTSGMYIMMRGDLLESHVPYIVMIAKNLIEGNSIWYSFDISMGMDTSLVLAYYVVNPFNILFLIFNKVDYNIIVAIIMIIKMAIAAICFQFFSSRVLKLEDFRSVIISICYAFCGFMAAYGSYHIMWIDAFMLLPLICYLIIYSFKNNNYVYIIICYSYIFITQFYTGYMVGLFSFMFVCAYFVYAINKDNYKILLKNICSWGISVLVSIMISAIVWVPALYFLVNNNPDDATSFTNINMTFLEIINSLFWGQFQDNIGRHSFTYCGIPVLLFAPFYFFNSKISRKERVLAGIIIFIISSGYVYIPLYKLFHAFDAPDSFWFRFSFLLSFALCSITARQLKYISGISFKTLLMYIIGLVLFYCLEMRLQAIEHYTFQQDSVGNLLINVIFIAAWIIVLYLFIYKYTSNKSLIILLSTLIIGTEVISNMSICLYAKSKEDTYYNWEKQCKYAITSIENNELSNNEFYRVIINNDMIHNSDSLFGYNGITDFGSSENYNLRKTMSNLGYGTTTRMTMGSGYNPVANMLLGVKYVVQCYGNESIITDTNRSDYSTILPTISLYETTLNVGYMVENSILEYSFPGRNDFENCNDLLANMTGNKFEVYSRVSKNDIKYVYDNSILYQLNNDLDDKYYISFSSDEGTIEAKVKNNNYDGVFVQFQTNEPLAIENDIWFSGGNNIVNGFDYYLNLSSMIEMEYSEIDDAYHLYICKDKTTNNEIVFDDINYYTYNYSSQIDAFYDLVNEQLYVDEYRDGYIKGHISVDSDRRVLFTSIPYDENWVVTVNGNRVETFSTIDDTFLSIVLPDKGDYVIEMKYKNNKVIFGAGISALGTIILAIYSFVNIIKRISKKGKYEKK